MTREEAIHRLLVHGAYDEEEFDQGLIGSFRLYRGLRHDFLREVETCIQTLEDEFYKPCVDTRIMLALWSICTTTRGWVLDDGSMVRRNDLIMDEDLETLTRWLDGISLSVELLLGGQSHGVDFKTL